MTHGMVDLIAVKFVVWQAMQCKYYVGLVSYYDYSCEVNESYNENTVYLYQYK